MARVSFRRNPWRWIFQQGNRLVCNIQIYLNLPWNREPEKESLDLARSESAGLVSWNDNIGILANLLLAV